MAQEHHAPSFSILREIRRLPRVVGAFPWSIRPQPCCGQAACCVSCERAFRGESGARLDTQGLAVTRLIIDPRLQLFYKRIRDRLNKAISCGQLGIPA